MSEGIFITGTDTGVGKTFVGVGLLQAMKERGMNVCPMKPVETGCSIKKGRLIPADTVELIRASGVDENIDSVNPYRFSNPLAPSVAAELEGVTVSKRKIISSYKRLSRKYETVIVEGAGGIMVPVDKKYLFLDLIADLNIPLVIVSRPGLGTINHTLLAIKAAESRGLNIIGIIINSAAKSRMGTAEQTNPEVIEQLGKAPIIGNIKFTDNNSSSKKEFQRISDRLLSFL